MTTRFWFPICLLLPLLGACGDGDVGVNDAVATETWMAFRASPALLAGAHSSISPPMGFPVSGIVAGFDRRFTVFARPDASLSGAWHPTHVLAEYVGQHRTWIQLDAAGAVRRVHLIPFSGGSAWVDVAARVDGTSDNVLALNNGAEAHFVGGEPASIPAPITLGWAQSSKPGAGGVRLDTWTADDLNNAAARVINWVRRTLRPAHRFLERNGYNVCRSVDFGRSLEYGTRFPFCTLAYPEEIAETLEEAIDRYGADVAHYVDTVIDWIKDLDVECILGGSRDASRQDACAGACAVPGSPELAPAGDACWQQEELDRCDAARRFRARPDVIFSADRTFMRLSDVPALEDPDGYHPVFFGTGGAAYALSGTVTNAGSNAGGSIMYDGSAHGTLAGGGAELHVSVAGNAYIECRCDFIMNAGASLWCSRDDAPVRWSMDISGTTTIEGLGADDGLGGGHVETPWMNSVRQSMDLVEETYCVTAGTSPTPVDSGDDCGSLSFQGVYPSWSGDNATEIELIPGDSTTAVCYSSKRMLSGTMWNTGLIQANWVTSTVDMRIAFSAFIDVGLPPEVQAHFEHPDASGGASTADPSSPPVLVFDALYDPDDSDGTGFDRGISGTLVQIVSDGLDPGTPIHELPAGSYDAQISAWDNEGMKTTIIVPLTVR